MEQERLISYSLIFNLNNLHYVRKNMMDYCAIPPPKNALAQNKLPNFK